jgi:hypothetical protein
MDQKGDSNPYRLVTTLLEKGAKKVWKSLGKKKALKYNNLRAIFVTFCGERGIRTYSQYIDYQKLTKLVKVESRMAH